VQSRGPPLTPRRRAREADADDHGLASDHESQRSEQLKTEHFTSGFPRSIKLPVKRQGYFEDDDTQHLTLEVTARTEKGVKATEITLESLDDMALAAGRSDAADSTQHVPQEDN
jgi:hypothetical protein